MGARTPAGGEGEDEEGEESEDGGDEEVCWVVECGWEWAMRAMYGTVLGVRKFRR